MFLGCLFESFTTQSRPWNVATSLKLSSCSLCHSHFGCGVRYFAESGMRMRLTEHGHRKKGDRCVTGAMGQSVDAAPGVHTL